MGSTSEEKATLEALDETIENSKQLDGCSKLKKIGEATGLLLKRVDR
jgi:hypothetical protein